MWYTGAVGPIVNHALSKVETILFDHSSSQSNKGTTTLPQNW